MIMNRAETTTSCFVEIFFGKIDNSTCFDYWGDNEAFMPFHAGDRGARKGLLWR